MARAREDAEWGGWEPWRYATRSVRPLAMFYRRRSDHGGMIVLLKLRSIVVDGHGEIPSRQYAVEIPPAVVEEGVGALLMLRDLLIHLMVDELPAWAHDLGVGIRRKR